MASLDIIENNSKIKAVFDTWGLPCTYTYGAVLQEYQVTGSETKIKDVSINFGEQFTFDLPSNVTLWKLTGTTTTFKKITIIGKNGMTGLIDFQNQIGSAGKNNLIYYTNMPSGVND